MESGAGQEPPGGGDCMTADFSKTCNGCRHIKTEEWTPTETAFRCFAPGPNCGYVVGVVHFLPYIPAWCPRNIKEESENETETRNLHSLRRP